MSKVDGSKKTGSVVDSGEDGAMSPPPLFLTTSG